MNNVQRHHCQQLRTQNIINNINYSEKIFCAIILFKNKNRCLLEDHRNCLISVSSIQVQEEGKKDAPRDFSFSALLDQRREGAQKMSYSSLHLRGIGNAWVGLRRSVGPQRAIPSITWADAVVIQLHDCGRNALAHAGARMDLAWCTNASGPGGHVGNWTKAGRYALRHVILECIVPNYTTISMRNFLKSCKGRDPQDQRHYFNMVS